MLIDDTLDELDLLLAELSDLRSALAAVDGSDSAQNALWDAEAGLRRVSERAESRARILRRAIELRVAREAGSAGPQDRRSA